MKSSSAKHSAVYFQKHQAESMNQRMTKPIARTEVRTTLRRCASLTLSFLLLSCLILTNSQAATAAASQPIIKTKKHKIDSFRLPIFEKTTDPHTLDLSPEAVQLANTLNLCEKLLKLKELQQQVQQQSAGGATVPIELRQDLTDAKLEVIERIEQARLEIDFVAAEIEEEQAAIEEVLKCYSAERDERVNVSNRYAFRTNGVLWAAAEGIAIPGYKYPKLSIPSGALGVVAGLVPMLFSEVAYRSLGGFHHERRAYPNMLTKFYNLPTIPRTEYPDSVWTHLNLPPTNNSKSRREMLMDHWQHNQNIQTLINEISNEKIKRITGHDQSDLSIDLLSDRSSMLRELKAVVLQMTRPLMELSMCVREKKLVTGRLISGLEQPDPQ